MTMRLWEIFDAIAARHWRASDAAKLAGNDGKHGHPALLLGELGVPTYYARMSAIEGDRV